MRNRQSSKEPGLAETTSPGFLRRAGAMLYDTLLLAGVLFFATAAALPFNHGQAFKSEQYFYPLYLLIISFLFLGWFWTHGGQTLGLRSWKLKLVSKKGQPVNWRQALLRFVGAILSWLCLGIGFFWIIVDKNKFSWHDYLSGTYLVYYRDSR